MENTGIQWTDRTDNPIVKVNGGFYCVKVSPGCKYCYAEGVNKRFNNETHVPYQHQDSTPELMLRRDILDKWKSMKKPRKIFVSSMTDVFAEFVPEMWVFEILAAMIGAGHHTFQLLTKRATRMRHLVNKYCVIAGIDYLPAHIICMVSVENQQYASERIPELLETKCLTRGLSIEPLIGRIDSIMPDIACGPSGIVWNSLNGNDTQKQPQINWVIVGGESGVKTKRPMHPEWARMIRDRCATDGIPFFFKQWGEWSPEGDVVDTNKNRLRNTNSFGMFRDGLFITGQYELGMTNMFKVGKHKAGRLLDGKEYNEFPIIER